MALKRTSEPTEKWKPSLDDVKKLSEGMAQFSVKEFEYEASGRVFKKKQYPFEQYCESRGYITFNPDGQIAVKTPLYWQRACDTYDFYKWKKGKEMEQTFIDYPEEKVAYDKNLEGVFAEIKNLFKKLINKP